MPHSRCLESAMVAWGWSFDLFTVAIYIVDVVSDVMVAAQFCKDGHNTWFWIVTTSLILSNILYTVFSTELIQDYYRRVGRAPSPRLLFWVVIFPFAQLAPIAAWVFGRCLKDDQEENNAVDDWYRHDWEQLDSTSLGGNAMHLMTTVHLARKTRVKTHRLFLIQTLAESVPQSIVQMLAMVFLGEPSSLQVLSLVVSLLSIVAKTHFVCALDSFTITTMIFKSMLVAHDVFSLFYIAATLHSEDQDVSVSYLSYSWALKLLVFCCCGVIVAVVLLIVVMHDITNRTPLPGTSKPPTSETVGITLSFVVLGLFGFGPAMLAAESAKLIWVIYGLAELTEPHKCLFPQYCLLYSFVQRGQWDERVKSILVEYTELYKNYVVIKAIMKATGANSHTSQPTAADCQKYFTSRRNDMEIDAVRRARMVLNGGVEFDGTEAEQEAVKATPYTAGSVWRVEKTARIRALLPQRNVKGILTVIAAVGATVYSIGQLYTILFPFINYSFWYEQQSLTQHACFMFMIAALLIAVPLIPSVLSYVNFCREMEVVSHTSSSLLDASTELSMTRFAVDVCRGYYLFSQRQLLLVSIPFTVLPPDVIEVVSSVLNPDSLDLSTVSVQQHEALRKQWDAVHDDGHARLCLSSNTVS